MGSVAKQSQNNILLMNCELVDIENNESLLFHTLNSGFYLHKSNPVGMSICIHLAAKNSAQCTVRERDAQVPCL